MAKITGMPSQAIIDQFKGVLDFYVFMGIPCVRTWPRYDETHMSQASRDQRPYFAYINSMAKQLPDSIIQAYKDQASATRLRWVDVLIRCYLNGDKV